MKEIRFGTVLIGGSEAVGTLPEDALSWLEHFMEANEDFIVGDSIGVDLALQNYLNSQEYSGVTVYYSGEASRFNVGGWDAEQVAMRRGEAMTEDADCAFLIWNGESRGTGELIEELRRLGKPIFIYRTDFGRLRVVRRKASVNSDN